MLAWLFRGSEQVLLRNPMFVIFRGGGSGPPVLAPLYPPMSIKEKSIRIERCIGEYVTRFPLCSNESFAMCTFRKKSKFVLMTGKT